MDTLICALLLPLVTEKVVLNVKKIIQDILIINKFKHFYFANS